MKKIKLSLIILFCILAYMNIKNAEVNVSAKQTVFVMGDSKSCYYSKKQSPKEGWVQEFVNYLKTDKKITVQYPEDYMKYKDVTRYDFAQYRIENWSMSGLSCNSVYHSGRYAAMLDKVQKKDYVIIALQHNDGRDSVGEPVSQYKKYLDNFTQDIKQKGAQVVFMTTPPKNYLKNKTIKMHVPEYRKVMLGVAKKQKCQSIDLDKIATDYFNFRDRAYVNSLYLKLAPGKYPAWENGIDDNTHFTKKGAKVLAKMIAVDIQAGRKINGLKFKQDTTSLYKTYKKACAYKEKKYTKATWKRMVKQRDHAWKVLYTPDATKKQEKIAERNLKKALKMLKKKK